MIKREIIHKSEKSSRILEIELNQKTLSTPTYFPAISSYGIKPPFCDLLYLLHHHMYPRVLVSAYDLFHMEANEKRRALSLVGKFMEKGILFMDSGLFESWWKMDKKWDMSSYKGILSQVDFHLYSSFDVYRDEERGYEDFRERTYDNVLESSVFLNSVAFFAILHESSPIQLLKLVEEYLTEHADTCGNIAVAERDIGKSIQERTETIFEIRKLIDNYDDRNLLHVLGCGHPLSLLLYSYCGADTFDSLDWLKFIVDPDDLSVIDFAYLDLLKCGCRVCTDMPYRKADYLERVLLHNLLFYQDFVMQIQSLIRNNNLKAYLKRHVGEEIMNNIEKY